MQERIAQQAATGERQKHFQKRLMLAGVALQSEFLIKKKTVYPTSTGIK
jgi:hypothetical protein